MNTPVGLGFLARLRNRIGREGLVMKTSSNKVGKLLAIGRRSTLAKAVVCTTCMTLIIVAVVASVGKATSGQEEKRARMHKRNPFFDPAAAAAKAAAAAAAVAPSAGVPVESFPLTDQVVSLKEVPVAEPMAVVIPVTTTSPAASIPQGHLTFQSLTDCTQVTGGLEPPCIVKDEAALIRLGKALFWDMQVGSDGIQACATCHFNAGADIRTTNQINSGQASEDFHSTPNPAPTGCPANPTNSLTGDSFYGNSTVPFTANDPLTPNPPGPHDPPLVGTCTGFDPLSPFACNVPGHPTFAPNSTVVGGDFPLNDWNHPTRLVPRGIGKSVTVTLQQEMFDAIQDTNDVVASQGVRLTKFTGVNPGSSVDSGTPLCDIANTSTPGIPSLSGVQRRTEPRNAPTMINAILNFDNLWDGKASFIFNGWDAFGFRNRTNTLKKNINGTLTNVFLRVTNSSLASVGAAVPTSNITMSFQGRTMPDLGKKMVTLRPLAKQRVHHQDSVLGSLAREEGNGLNVTTYADMLEAAFQDQWWNHFTRDIAFNGSLYTQMEFNFSMFFGLAVQAYQATLISDDTPYDRFQGAFHPARHSNGDPCTVANPCSPIPPDPNALTAQQRAGFALFNDVVPNIGTHCADCHVPPITTSHTILDNQPDSQGVPSLALGEAIEHMFMGDDLAEANYDHGFYNIGIRRTTDDKGRKAAGGSLNPFSGVTATVSSISRAANVVTVNVTLPTPPPAFALAVGQSVTISGVTDTSFNGTVVVTAVNSPTQFTYAQTAAAASSSGGFATGPNAAFPFSLVELVALRDSAACKNFPGAHVGCLPPDVARFVPNTPIFPRRVTHGAFKVPNLRNLKFTGPYFHVGDSATLRQVVEFYTRGGNFPNTNLHDKTVDVDGIPGLDITKDPGGEERIQALVDFLAEGLKDERVAFERAPFDHPEICVPNGSPKGKEENEFEGCGGKLDTTNDVFLRIPAVGRNGRRTELPTFLNLDPQQSDTSVAASGTGTGGGATGGAAQIGGNTGATSQTSTSQSGYPGGKAPTGGAVTAQAGVTTGAPLKKDSNGNIPAGFAEAGYIEAATLKSAAANSGGTLTMNGTVMIVPDNSVIQFPANTLTWAQLFNTAGNFGFTPVYDPALTPPKQLTIAANATGLALMDNPSRIQTQSPFIPFNAVVIGNIDVQNSRGFGVGAYIVGLILPIGQDLGNAGQGFITCIDYTKGRFEVGGTVSTLAGGACGATPTGQVVEINDPLGRYGYAHSPDQRWSVDPQNPTIAAGNGYPMGIPKVGPASDPDRPAFNRMLNPTNTADPNYDPFLQPGAPLLAFSMPPSSAAGTTQPDPWKQAPLLVGDYVIYSGILCKNDPTVAFNPLAPLNQQTYISANTVSAPQLMIYTAPGAAPGDVSVGPAYLQLARGVVGTGPRPAADPVTGLPLDPAAIVPANASLGIVGGTIPIIDPKLNTRIVGFVTDPTQLVDIFAVDIDPASGSPLPPRLLGSALPDPGVPGFNPGAPPKGPVGRFVFEVDKVDFQPTTRVYMAVSEHGALPLPQQQLLICTAGTCSLALGAGLMSGQYQAPMFNFVYPDLVPGFPVIPNNFNSQDFLRLGEGGNTAAGPLNPFPPCLSFVGDPVCP